MAGWLGGWYSETFPLDRSSWCCLHDGLLPSERAPCSQSVLACNTYDPADLPALSIKPFVLVCGAVSNWCFIVACLLAPSSEQRQCGRASPCEKGEQLTGVVLAVSSRRQHWSHSVTPHPCQRPGQQWLTGMERFGRRGQNSFLVAFICSNPAVTWLWAIHSWFALIWANSLMICPGFG